MKYILSFFVVVCLLNFQLWAGPSTSSANQKPATKSTAASGKLPWDKIPIDANNPFANFKVGEGADYYLNLQTGPSLLKLYIVESTKNTLAFESQMEAENENPLLQLEMKQQFHLAWEGGMVKLTKGYLQIPQNKNPQILPPEFLEGFSGVQTKTFLLRGEEELKKQYQRQEKVSVRGKTYDAHVFQVTENGQTLTYWISDAIKPFGLVKLTSSGAKKDFNYQLELKGTTTGNTKKLDITKAEPLNEMVRAFLPMLMQGMGIGSGQ